MGQIIRIFGLWILVAGMLLPGLAQAGISSVTPSPSQRNVALASSTSFTATWNVVRNNLPSTFPPGATVTSVQGKFTNIDNTVTYGVVPATLSQTRPLVGPSTTFVFTERVRVPAEVAYRAYKSGAMAVYYNRAFSDDGFTSSSFIGVVKLNITGSSAAGFSLSRLSLRFDDDTALRVVDKGAKLRAYADVTYTGTGLLQGAWEIAEPPTTLGKPIYQTLQLVRRMLVGSGQERIYAPPLPTGTRGFYLLRLRVTKPQLPVPVAELPFIRYVVSHQAVHWHPAQVLTVTAPAPGAVLGKDTGFAWQEVAGARAYQVELYAKGPFSVIDTLPDLGSVADTKQWRPSGAPVAGVLVPGDRTSAGLSALGDAHLKSGYVYRWRVLAIGKDGGLLAVSPWREVHTTP